MTIIAVDRDAGTMCADTRVTEGAFVAWASRKIITLPDGSLAGAAGDAQACLALLKWLEAGGDAEDFPDDADARVLVLRPNRAVEIYDSGPLPEEIAGRHAAIGTGATPCLAALMAGASLTQAIQITCALVTDCGGEITTLHLQSRNTKGKA